MGSPDLDHCGAIMSMSSPGDGGISGKPAGLKTSRSRRPESRFHQLEQGETQRSHLLLTESRPQTTGLSPSLLLPLPRLPLTTHIKTFKMGWSTWSAFSDLQQPLKISVGGRRLAHACTQVGLWVQVHVGGQWQSQLP